jgi:hypothetical protein
VAMVRECDRPFFEDLLGERLRVARRHMIHTVKYVNR